MLNGSEKNNRRTVPYLARRMAKTADENTQYQEMVDHADRNRTHGRSSNADDLGSNVGNGSDSSMKNNTGG